MEKLTSEILKTHKEVVPSNDEIINRVFSELDGAFNSSSGRIYILRDGKKYPILGQLTFERSPVITEILRRLGFLKSGCTKEEYKEMERRAGYGEKEPPRGYHFELYFTDKARDVYESLKYDREFMKRVLNDSPCASSY